MQPPPEGGQLPRAILIDIGGVLVSGDIDGLASEWGARLGISAGSFLAALFGGNDHTVLVGKVSEPEWWSVVQARLGVGSDVVSAIQRDMKRRQAWDTPLLEALGRTRAAARIGVISNAWPYMRVGISESGLANAVNAVILSCEVGYAKPDPAIYRMALRRIGVRPGNALLVDDTRENVIAAEALGIVGHTHTGSSDTIERINDFIRTPS